MRRHFPVVAALVLSGSCVATAPPPAPVRSITPVSAPFNRTWESVIDVFGERNIPIKQIERASGFVATDGLSLSREDQRVAPAWAKCERGGVPDRAVYNVIVRGDESQSTVRVTVKWEQVRGRTMQAFGCESTRRWEMCAEDEIRARAELAPPPTCRQTAMREE